MSASKALRENRAEARRNSDGVESPHPAELPKIVTSGGTAGSRPEARQVMDMVGYVPRRRRGRFIPDHGGLRAWKEGD
jgi:hypothetical protein